MSNLNVNTLTASQGVVLPGHNGAGNYPSGAVGKVIFDTSIGEIRVYNGSAWVGLSNEYDVDVLIVGGGGGGGASFGGGGGGGGVVFFKGYPVNTGQTYTIDVGSGGAGHPQQTDPGQNGSRGGNSRFGVHYAAGGGGGGSRGSGARWGVPADWGGSGGGAGHSNTAPRTIMGHGIPGMGHYGGWGRNNTSGTPDHAAGGGGGAAENGQDYREGSHAGNGGDGLPYDISGSTVYYGAGGGGGVYVNGNGGSGGNGGGGNGGHYAQSGKINQGSNATGFGNGGGGGGYTYAGGSGSGGIVIIRYPGSQRGSGGNVTTSGGFTRHTFNSAGSSSTFTA